MPARGGRESPVRHPLAPPCAGGGGSRLRILEAFAAGCPVVTTRTGVEGIAAEDGVHVRLAETVADFRDAILTLHRDPDALRAQTMAAFDLARHHHSREATAAILHGALAAHLSLPAAKRSAA